MQPETLRTSPDEHSFPVGRFLGPDGVRELQKLRCHHWPEEAEFINRSFARDQFRKFVSRMSQAIEKGLFDDPVNVGAAAGALEILAGSLCTHPESADYLIGCWRDHDCQAVIDVLTTPGRDERSEIPALNSQQKAATRKAKVKALGPRAAAS